MIAPPVAGERLVFALAIVPVVSNSVGNLETVAVFPVTGPITVVMTVALLATPGILPLLIFAIDELAVLWAAVDRTPDLVFDSRLVELEIRRIAFELK